MAPRIPSKNPGRAFNLYVKGDSLPVLEAAESLAKIRGISLSNLVTDALRGELQRANIPITVQNVEEIAEPVLDDEITEHMLEAGGTIHWYTLIRLAGTNFYTVNLPGLAPFQASSPKDAEDRLKRLISHKSTNVQPRNPYVPPRTPPKPSP